MKLQQQFHLHFYQQNTVWSEQDGGIFNRKCLASLLDKIGESSDQGEVE